MTLNSPSLTNTPGHTHMPMQTTPPPSPSTTTPLTHSPPSLNSQPPPTTQTQPLPPPAQPTQPPSNPNATPSLADIRLIFQQELATRDQQIDTLRADLHSLQLKQTATETSLNDKLNTAIGDVTTPLQALGAQMVSITQFLQQLPQLIQSAQTNANATPTLPSTTITTTQPPPPPPPPTPLVDPTPPNNDPTTHPTNPPPPPQLVTIPILPPGPLTGP
jgi:hypothetical protein